MRTLRFHTDPANPPAYTGFWVPGTATSKHLDSRSMIRVRAGQYYWVTGFPENKLPTTCEGRGKMFSSIAYASVLVRDENGYWYDRVSREKYSPQDKIFAFAEVDGKLHILYEDMTYPVKYVRASKTEITMYQSWT